MADPRMIAMLNVHSAALLAIFQTHPAPEKLREAFGRDSEAHFETTDENPEVGGFQQTWTDVYLQALAKNPNVSGDASPPPE
jgi:hypothetical protein